MALPTIGVLDKDGSPQTVNTANSARQAAADSQAVVLSTEDLAALTALATRLGEVQASPTANTVLDRLKALATAIAALPQNNVLGAGTAGIGKLTANSGVDIGDVDVTSVPTDPFGATADAASASGSISAKLRAIATALGVTALDLGVGTGGSRTLRVAIDSAQLDGSEYETVAASQTAQTLGATGGTGDFISKVVVIPATTSPGNVLLLDNATSITIFAGGADSVSNLVPFVIDLGMFSVSGAWKITTGSNVSVIGIGNFT